MKQFFDMDANEFGFADCDIMQRYDGGIMTRISDFTALDLNTGEIHMITGLDSDVGNACDNPAVFDDDDDGWR